MLAASCPRCHTEVLLHEGHANVTAAGIVVWHRWCWDARHEPLPEPVETSDEPDSAIATFVEPPPAPRRSGRWIAGGVAVGALGLVGAWMFHEPAIAADAMAAQPPAAEEPVTLRGQLALHEPKPPPLTPVWFDLETRYPIPTNAAGRALDLEFPTLHRWIHPVTSSPELFPEFQARWFGAERKGIERVECGAGHCGVDLDGPRGRPVVAVAAGRVVRVEHAENGGDGISGRFVRIQHDDGTITGYFHLDDIADGLQVGDHVIAGQFVGTLGATAVYSAPPHLHFDLEIPLDKDMRGEDTPTRFIDPAPFLVRATIAPIMTRRSADKPGS